MDIVDFANLSPPSSRLSVLDSYLREEDLSAPIDMYRIGVTNLLGYADVKELDENDFLGRLLVLGIVSTVEAYMRSMLSACLELCPVSQAYASKQNLHLGGAVWHGSRGFSRSAFEHQSFASKDDLSSACMKYLGIKLEDSQFKSVLDQYEMVCQLRHGIVHADGLLPGRNAVLLDIKRYGKPVRIVIRYQHIQEVAAVVDTLVASLNRYIFAAMCKRWAVDWRRRADWEPSDEQILFKEFWNVFH